MADLSRRPDDESMAGFMARYLGDPVSETIPADMETGKGVPRSALVEQVAKAISAGVGAKAATLGQADAPTGEDTDGPHTNYVRIYDDKTPPPKRSLKDMAALGLIPLGAGVLSGLLGSNDGAMTGVIEGLKAVKGQVNDEDKRYEKKVDEKQLGRSKLFNAKIIADVMKKSKAGGPDSINKNRYQKVDGIDPKTGIPYSYSWDRQEGKAGPLTGLDGNVIPYSSEVYKRFRPNPNYPDAPKPRAAAPAPEDDNTAYTTGQGAPQTSPEPGQPAKLPPQTKAPQGTPKAPAGAGAGAATKSPAAATKPAETVDEAMANIPEGKEDDARTAAKAEYDAIAANLNQMKSEAEDDMSPEPRQLADGTMESLLDVQDRVKDAKKRRSDADKALDKAHNNYADQVGKAIRQKDRLAQEAKNREVADGRKLANDKELEGVRQQGRESLAGINNDAKKDLKQTPGAKAESGPKTLNGKEAEKISQWDEAIASAEELKGRAKDEWVGMWDGRKPDQMVDEKTRADRAAFASAVGRMNDKYRHLITGAGAGMNELAKLEKNMPNATDTDAKTFEGKANEYIRELKRARGIYLGNMEKIGKDTSAFKGSGSGSGEGKKVVRRQYSKDGSKTKRFYEDGTSEVVNGIEK